MSNRKPSTYQPSELFSVFSKLLPVEALVTMVNATATPFYLRIFSPLIILWGFVYQALSIERTCDAVVSKVQLGVCDEWEAEFSVASGKKPHAEPLSRRLSKNNSAYCQSRDRLPLDWLKECVRLSAHRLHGLVARHFEWLHRTVLLLDGTTFLTQASPALIAHYGRHENQNGESHWPVLRSVAAFDLGTGAAVALVDGTLHQSEQFLATLLIQEVAARAGNWLEAMPGETPEETPEEAPLYVADRNFGVFLVAHAARTTGQDIVVRMTQTRAMALLKRFNAKHISSPGFEEIKWDAVRDVELIWYPSRKDDMESVPAGSKIHGRLIRRIVERPTCQPIELCLFTTLIDRERYSTDQIVDLYGERWKAELDFRELKDTLEMTHLRTKSVEMVRKELLAGVLAYNMIRGIIALAAIQTNCSPRDLSFISSWRRIRDMSDALVITPNPTWQQLEDRFFRLLELIGQCRIYRRKKPRKETRGVRGTPCPYPHIKGERNALVWRKKSKS